MNWLKDRRTAAGLTQAQLAERTGISQGHICCIERGKFKRLSKKTAEKLAAVLGCDRDALTDEGEIAIIEQGVIKKKPRKKPEPGELPRNWLKRRRVKAGMTQTKLASAAGLSRMRIYQIETGKAERILRDTMDKLASALGCSADELYEDFINQKLEKKYGK